ncbi:MAG: hypothetical protein ACKOAH_12740 [Pirellula sp.]
MNTQPKAAWQVYPVTLAKTADFTELALARSENSELLEDGSRWIQGRNSKSFRRLGGSRKWEP